MHAFLLSLLLFTLVSSQNIGFFRDKEAIWIEAEELIGKDLAILSRVKLSGSFGKRGVQLRQVEAKILSVTGDYEVTTIPENNSIVVSNIQIKAQMLYSFVRRLQFLGIPIPVWIWGDEGHGYNEIKANISLTKVYKVNEQTGKPQISTDVEIVEIFPLEKPDLICYQPDQSGPFVKEIINEQVTKKIWVEIIKTLNLYIDIKYQHISDRFNTTFHYTTLNAKEITLDYTIMSLSVVKNGLFFGVNGQVKGVEGLGSSEIAKIPKINSKAGSVQIYLSKYFIQNLVLYGAKIGEFQQVLNYQNADTKQLDWIIGDWVYILPDLREKYDSDANLEASCKIADNQKPETKLNLDLNLISVDLNFTCDFYIQKTKQNIFTLIVNTYITVLPKLVSDGFEQKGKLLFFEVDDITVGYGTAKIKDQKLSDKKQAILEFYVREFLKTLDGGVLFGSNLPIPGLRDPQLSIKGDYIVLAGYAISDNDDSESDDEDDDVLL